MARKILIILVVGFFQTLLFSQQMRLKKGVVIDSMPVLDSIPESFSLFLPTKFENKGKWPLLVVFDPKGRGKQAVSFFSKHAEEQGYILVASNAIHDSLSLSENMVRTGRLLTKLEKLLPINAGRVYAAGFDNGARLANVAPLVFKSIEGVVSCGAAIPNSDMISKKSPFHFIGIVGKEDFSYPEMLETEAMFNRLKLDNNILVFDGGKQWPPEAYMGKALHYFTLRAMARGFAEKDTVYIEKVLKRGMADVQQLLNEKKELLAYRELTEMQNAFRDLIAVDSIENALKELKKSKLYRIKKREEDAARFKESFLQEDYLFALEEDLATFNYSNLGWWNYQMAELQKFVDSENKSQRQMGRRLVGFVNALVDDNLDMVNTQGEVDDEAVIFLSMLKTITEPENFKFYLDVISMSSKYEDFGTALFYLEEALKRGYKDRDRLYSIEHTALLRVSPEFNKLIAKYLDTARYGVIEK